MVVGDVSRGHYKTCNQLGLTVDFDMILIPKIILKMLSGPLCICIFLPYFIFVPFFWYSPFLQLINFLGIITVALELLLQMHLLFSLCEL